ncbi:hypothetical protein [Roseovarius sp. MMSF_3305]|nr:hypothetical protein [Roseovarius sp. MMSF_3305]
MIRGYAAAQQPSLMQVKIVNQVACDAILQRGIGQAEACEET